MEDTPKKRRKPYDKGTEPQYIDYRYDLITHTWHWRVPSWKNAAETYDVHYNREKHRWECTCWDWIKHEVNCKHIGTLRRAIKYIRAERDAKRTARLTAALAPTPIHTSIERPVRGSLPRKGFSLPS